MKIWAVANQKGGVGKTTTAVNLGGVLARDGHRTLLLDMDPHGSMSAYFGLDPDTQESSLYQLFQAKKSAQALSPARVVCSTGFENLDMIPAATAMATLDRQLGATDGMGLVITQALHGLADRYEFVLIDCPPQLGVLMINALAACQHLIIPVQTEFLAVKGLERMLRTLEMIQRARHKVPAYTILPTMYDPRTRASTGTLRLLRERFAEHLWRSVIPVDTQFREASRLGIPLTLKAPKDRGSLAYAGLMQDLLADGTHSVAGPGAVPVAAVR
ncbi:MAG: ParA family protein [Gammaproteobacteria bacterium]|nr:ParA family protein [Gammaproteobacteria bacterium]MCF6363715.1 ParA family protein [Gammaproteobacteria bacterium]